MIIQILFLGIVSLCIAAAVFACVLYVHSRIMGYEVWDLFHTHVEPKQHVPPPPERRIGEVLMVPCKSSITPQDFMAVVVMQKLENDYYVVQTFHERPQRLTVHSNALVTREQAFGDSHGYLA
jgi:hypothetical protein